MEKIDEGIQEVKGMQEWLDGRTKVERGTGRDKFPVYSPYSICPPTVDKAAGGIASMGALTLSKTHAAKAG